MRGLYWRVQRRRGDSQWLRVAAEAVAAVGLLTVGLTISRASGAPMPFAGSLPRLALGELGPAPTTQVRVDVLADSGRAVLVTSGDHAALVDGGSGPVGEAVVRRLDQLSIPRLDDVFLTRGNASSAVGLVAVMDALPVEHLWDLVPGNTCPAHKAVLADAHAHGVSVRPAEAGTSVTLGPAKLQVLWPLAERDPQAETLAAEPGLVRLEDGRLRMLLADGLTPGELGAVERLGSALKAQVLEVPGGGRAGSVPTSLLQMVGPRVALMEPSAGGPDPATTAELQLRHIVTVEVARTQDLRLESDGRGLVLGFDAGEPGSPLAEVVPPQASGPCA